MPKPAEAPEHTAVAPLLPPASIDFNALHDACARGLSAEDALAAALVIEPRDLAEGEMLAEGTAPSGVEGEPIEAPAADQL